MKATIKDVAFLAGVSPSTVSRVITGCKDLNIKDVTRQRILNAVKQLDYKPNNIARSLRIKATNTLGMIIPDITNNFFSILYKGAEKLASEKEYNIILCNTDDDILMNTKFINSLMGRQADGLLLATANIDNDVLKDMNMREYPYVFVNRRVENEIGRSIIIDNFMGTTMAMEHLMKLGHVKIAHISGPSSAYTAVKRNETYKSILKLNGFPYDPNLVIQSEMSEEGGYRAFTKLIERHLDFTAIFAANDLIAIGVMTAAKEKGFRIPEDFSIVGFDDLPISKKISPSLTTIRVPIYEMGYMAADILIKEIKKESDHMNVVVLKPELTVRESTSMVVKR